MRLRCLLLTTLILPVATATAGEAASPWRGTITLPADLAQLDALDLFVIAEQLGDSTAVQHALAREDWDQYVRDWCAARWAQAQGDESQAMELFDTAAAHWPADSGEPDLVYEFFDRQRLELALDSGDLAAADEILHAPLRPHHDAVWRGLRARVELEQGQVEEARERFVMAWEQADPLERRHPVFLRMALAQLAAADTLAAINAWQDAVDVIERPERLREAGRIWDATPALAQALRAAEDPARTLRFLVRSLRRQQALDMVRWRIDAGLGNRADQELFVAEQMYKLREHDALLAWVDAVDREGFTDEQLAATEGYRWGVARRQGSSLDVAHGFDAVAEAWPATERGAEAWWEAAWMYELSDAPEDAADRYRRHVQATQRSAFRSSAALRAVFLPWRDGNREAAAAALAEFDDALGTGMEQAAAWWLINEGPMVDRLHAEHPASPFWRGLAPALVADAVPDPAGLFARQHDALRAVGHALDLADPLQELPEELTAISRLARLGLRHEASIRLHEYGRTHGGDDRARLQIVGIALENGLPEMQARHAWFLERRLGESHPELESALTALSLPTPFAGAVLAVCADLELPPALVWSLMRRESFFDADVVSLAGAYGLMQLLPDTAQKVAAGLGQPAPRPSDLFHPPENVLLGGTYLAGLRAEAAGNWVRALASYNAGESNGERWESRLRPGEDPAVGILLISYTETRSYVYNVLRAAHLYEDTWRAAS